MYLKYQFELYKVTFNEASHEFEKADNIIQNSIERKTEMFNHPKIPWIYILFSLSKLTNLLIPDEEYEDVKFTMSKCGNALLVDKAGYMYHKVKNQRSKITDRINWICYDGKKFKCFGMAMTEGVHIINKASKHNHKPKPEQSKDSFSFNF